MNSPALTYLYTLATLAVTFVGFSALVIIMRQTLGGAMSKLDILITRIFIQLGFMVAAGCMLPPMLSLFQISDAQIWRLSSIAMALPSLLFATTYPSRRKAASGVPMPVHIGIGVLCLLLLSLSLFFNAAGIFAFSGPGPFAAALTGILFVSGWGYLQALNTVLRHHRLVAASHDPGGFQP
ncbi:MAG TPA: hypothetical protein VGM15_14600 [Burkholderiaceae bacterium]